MDMAMDMRDCVQFVPDPRPGVNDHIKIRQVIVFYTYINVYAEASEALDIRIKIKLKFYGVSDYNRAFRSNARGVSRGMSSRRGQILLH